MAPKKTATKKTKKQAPKEGPVPASYSEPKSVRIERADNGLTVRTWGPKGEVLRVAKSEQEALRHAKELLK